MDNKALALTGFVGASFAVTGAASGIGLAVATIVASAGGRVLAGDVNHAALDDLRRTASARSLPIEPHYLDVTDPDSVGGFIASAGAHGDLGGVVCSAGISPDMSLLDMTLEAWERVLRVNLTGTFLVAQAAVRNMIGQSRSGAIVTVASAAPHRGTPNLGHYNAAKAGVGALTRTMAREFGPLGIRANCVAPGAVDTPLFWGRMTAEQAERFSPDNPLGRLGAPRDLAECIAFLLSDQSSWITGQTVHVNGGSLLL
jgi:3-oxoacyl-[acyl-carrier protein] reductase